MFGLIYDYILLIFTLAVQILRLDVPIIKLDSGRFIGVRSNHVSKFLGIPYGQSTGGKNRFHLPQAVSPYRGGHYATKFGPSCPQQALFNIASTLHSVPEDVLDMIENSVSRTYESTSENCLTVDVIVPSQVKCGAALPVVVWIHGGAFAMGGTSGYNGTAIVERSIELGQPIIYVSMNYRLAAWGFLASKEVKDAGIGNLGLRDQRLALNWIQKYISRFGGDPSKVTLWGQSAGAISASFQMLVNGGDTQGLFRGAFLESGAPTPVGDATHGQRDYDDLVINAGCSGATDTLECLRNVPLDVLQKAVDASPSVLSHRSLNLAWQPRTDGALITENPYNLVAKGKVADVPIVIGSCDDEGTLFSIVLFYIFTDSQFKSHIKSYFLPSANQSILDAIGSAYPNDITEGSPFDTGLLNALTPQFKRLAAFQGDAAFQGPRRFFLKYRSDNQNAWAYLNKRYKWLPFIGSAHSTDLVQVFGGGELLDYLIHFVDDLDPNGKHGSAQWPRYNSSERSLLTLLDSSPPLAITRDDFREAAIDLLTNINLEFPL